MGHCPGRHFPAGSLFTVDAQPRAGCAVRGSEFDRGVDVGRIRRGVLSRGEGLSEGKIKARSQEWLWESSPFLPSRSGNPVEVPACSPILPGPGQVWDWQLLTHLPRMPSPQPPRPPLRSRPLLGHLSSPCPSPSLPACLPSTHQPGSLWRLPQSLKARLHSHS